MRRPISRKAHGLLEYPYDAALAAAPELLGFAGDPAAARAARALAATAALSAALTRAEWAPVKVLPYRLHLAGDALAGLTALAAPWALGFSGDARARNLFLGVGALALAVWALSEPEEMA